MNNRIKSTTYALISLMLVFGIFTAPVSAHRGADDTDETASPTPTKTASADDTSKKSASLSELKESAKKQLEENREKAREAVTTLKEKASTKTIEERQQACESRHENAEKRMDNAADYAARHKAVFDKIFERAKSFKETKSLAVANYDELVTAAEAAGAAADDAISAMKELNIGFDCKDVDTVASNLGAFKSSVENTRAALKEYRTAIKQLIVALKASANENTEVES